MSEKIHNENICRLCARNCGVRRDLGELGFCGESNRIRVGRAALHMWEEPCISGQSGSGAVFFSGCSLKCIFCQNYSISSEGGGKEITVGQLADTFLSLEQEGANNINLVTPGHFVPQIIKSIEIARKSGMSLPIVYNTGSYEKLETIAMLDGYVDVYLPDLKFFAPELGKMCAYAPDYFETAALAIQEMFRQTGKPEFYKETVNSGSSDLLMKKGVIVRHLILPGHTKDSKKIVEYLHHTYGNDIYISLMNQFTPIRTCAHEELNRKLTVREYNSVVEYALKIGVENAFVQEGRTASSSFIPAFDGTGVK